MGDVGHPRVDGGGRRAGTDIRTELGCGRVSTQDGGRGRHWIDRAVRCECRGSGRRRCQGRARVWCLRYRRRNDGRLVRAGTVPDADRDHDDGASRKQRQRNRSPSAAADDHRRHRRVGRRDGRGGRGRDGRRSVQLDELEVGEPGEVARQLFRVEAVFLRPVRRRQTGFAATSARAAVPTTIPGWAWRARPRRRSSGRRVLRGRRSLYFLGKMHVGPSDMAADVSMPGAPSR